MSVRLYGGMGWELRSGAKLLAFSSWQAEPAQICKYESFSIAKSSENSDEACDSNPGAEGLAHLSSFDAALKRGSTCYSEAVICP
jgi:hypothetical protein